MDTPGRRPAGRTDATARPAPRWDRFGRRVLWDADTGILMYAHAPTVEADRAHDVRFEVVDGGERYRISDRSALVSICGVDATVASCQFPAPCFHEGGNVHEATCEAAGATEFDALLGDLNDRVVNTTDLRMVACGGPGADVIEGGAGRDTLGGGADRDELRGGAGDDELTVDLARVLGSEEAPPPRACLPGTDNPRRGAARRRTGGRPARGWSRRRPAARGDGEDLVFAYEGDDRVEGGEGSDIVLGLDGADALVAGGGDDFVFGGEGDDAIDAGAGNDVLGLTVRYDADGLAPGDQDAITTEAGDDRFDGGPGDDTFMAGPGETLFDLIDPFATLAALRRTVINRDVQSDALNGADRYIGGPGEDRVSYLNRGLPVDVSLDGVPNDGSRAEGDGVDPDIELVMGGAGDDVLTAGPGGTFIFGDRGADSIRGGPGPDELNGGSDDDDDRVAGAEGDDELRGGPGEDELDGGPGRDAMLGGAGDDELAGGADADGLEGGTGADLLDGGEGDDCLNGFVLAQSDSPCPLGGPLTPAVGADGNDLLRGGPGTDRLAGGPGEDVADYSQNRGSVTVILPGASFPQARAAAGRRDDIGVDVEGARGGRGHDLLVGNANDNLLDGGAGDDQVEGGGGVDRLRGGSGRDLVVARDGVPDAVRCGTRPDIALVDAEDEVVAALSDQCERVDGGGSGARRGAVRIGPARGCSLPMRLPGARRWFVLGTRAALPARSLVDASGCAARTPGVVLRRGAFSVFARGGRAHVGLRGGRGCKRLDVTTAARALVVHTGRVVTSASRAAWSVSEGCAGAAVRVRSGRVRVIDRRSGRRLVLGPGRAYGR